MKKKKSNPLSRREFLMICSKALPFTGIFFIPFTADQLLFAQKTKEYDPTQHEYAMGINIHKCIGCGRCADACKKENNVPREPYYFRTWVERYIISTDGETYVDSPNGGIDGFPEFKDNLDILRTFFVPKLCNQCANPPCVQVCPVGATFLSRDGVVLVDEKYCVGCRYCIQACPYGCRYISYDIGTADKCSFCYHRIHRGLPTACVQACPRKARICGNLKDPNNPVSAVLHSRRYSILKPEMATNPKCYYIGLDLEVI